MVRFSLILFFFFWCFSFCLYSQELPKGYAVLAEVFRRNALCQNDSSIQGNKFIFKDFVSDSNSKSGISYGFVPLRISYFLNTQRPYWFSPNGMLPSRGSQVYINTGVYFNSRFFQIDFQPEFIFSQNKAFEGSNFLPYISPRGEDPERYGDSTYSRFWFGQSKIAGTIGAFELGISTRNLWWGPGQWNSLTFSNNAQGFVHGVFGTKKPARTFFGSFEIQLISGFPKSKKYPAYQNDSLTSIHSFRKDRDRYLNGLNVSISPKWIKGLSIGAARTVQTFTDSVSVNNFIDVFPVFWGITKESVGSDLIGESDRGRDQQITVFFRQVIPKAGLEFYGEFGRRDHALNVRDLVLSPAHSRAYLLGFNKVFNLSDSKLIQIRGEITHQSQSVNWVVRDDSTTPWHTNNAIGGFTNLDQAMGVGIGMGSNIQMLEVSRIDGINKIGLYLERLPQHADFYDTADLAKIGYQPWVDFTAGPIFDHQWKNLIFSGRMLFTYASNYYWSQDLGSQNGVDFPIKQNKFSTSTQVNLIYLFNKD